MYKALNYWVFGGFDGQKTPYEFIDYAHAKGLDGVELTVGDALPVDISEEECGKIADFAAKRGIGLRSLATGFYWNCSPGSPDAAERRQALDFSKKYLRIAHWLGAETVLIIPGYTRVAWDASRPEVSYRDAWHWSQESVKELLPVAHKLAVNIALENVWNRFLLSPMEWKLYLDSFHDSAVGIYLDVGNCCLYGRPTDYIDLLGSHIKAVHLKNFAETDSGGGLHGFGDDLLKGEVDFGQVFTALAKIGYNGPATVEMIPFSRLPELVLPDAVLAGQTVEKLKSL